MTCAPSEDSDQPWHPPSLIRVFAVRIMDSSGPNPSSDGQRRFWSDWANARLIWVFGGRAGYFVGFVLLFWWCKREYVEPNSLKEWKVSIFKIVDQRIKFYSQNTNLLPPKPKSTIRHLKQSIQDFRQERMFCVPAYLAASNVVVVWRLHYINTLKLELSSTEAYKENFWTSWTP